MSAFQRIGQTLLYAASATPGAATRVAFLLPAASPAPGSIALGEALSSNGWFIFVPAFPDPDALGDFIGAAQRYLANAGRAGARFAYFSSIDPKALAATIVRATASQGGLVTTDRADLIVRNVTLRIPSGTAIIAGSAGDTLQFTAPAKFAMTLMCSALGTGPVVTFPLAGTLQLPLLTGSAVDGCSQFTIVADNAGLDGLDAGQRYFVSSAQSPGYVDSMRYPLIDLQPPAKAAGATQIAFSVSLDPLDALNPARSYLSVDPAKNTAQLRSHLRSPLGGVMMLQPTSTSSFVFSTALMYEPGSSQPLPDQPLFLTPSGTFGLALDSSSPQGTYANNLMCGLSGVEYCELPSGATIAFEAGGAAFSSAEYTFDRQGQIAQVAFKPLSTAATTSYVQIANASANAAISYYAQPSSSIVHKIPATGPSSGPALLPYLPLLSGSPAQAVPIVPYAGAAFASDDVAKAFEYQVLSPTRRAAIPPPAPALAALGGDQQGTTPQGLLLNIRGSAWEALTLGRVLQGDPSSATPADVQIYDVSGDLRDALQSNQLFLAISDANAFLSCCSLPYLLTTAVFDTLRLVNHLPPELIAALQGLSGTQFIGRDAFDAAVLACMTPYVLTADVITRIGSAGAPHDVTQALDTLAGQTFKDLPSFNAALTAALGTANFDLWGLLVTRYAANGYYTYNGNAVPFGDAVVSGAARLSIWSNGFEFDLSPYRWAAFGTVLIFKFMNKPLAQLVGDVHAWAHADTFNGGSQNAVQQQLQGIIDAASASNDADLRYFVETVANDPNWNGIIALSARVPLSGLPAQLEGLAAGIDPARFSAHHVGINVTPVTVNATGLSIAPSSIFGLIDYEDPAHISDTQSAYQYKVLRLKVLILNSNIADFSSKVELLANQLFGDVCTLQGSGIGNLIDFDGIYQRHGSDGSYLFTNTQLNLFEMDSTVLDYVSISRAQFVTIVPANTSDSELVRTKFLFTGAIGFKNLDPFDIFSFGDGTSSGLAFTGLSVDMDFQIDIPSYKTFAFDTSATALDLATSVARPASVYNHFPLKLTTLGQGDSSNSPATSNYMPVTTPLGSGGLTDTWFALEFSLNLGTPGALAAATGFTAGFIAAWSPATSSPSLFIGLSLPGVKGGERAISIEGILKLNFGEVAFVASGTTYILELRNISIGVLSLSFPPNGQTNILLFGDPTGADRETLGWYAAYLKNGSGKQPPSQLASFARKLPS